MVEPQKQSKFRKFIKERFRITFFHDDFKPVFSLRFTLFSLILWIIGYATVIIIITTIIIAKTPLKEYIPGYGTDEEKKQLVQLTLLADSLQRVMHHKNIYLQSILKTLKGEKASIPPPPKSQSKKTDYQQLQASTREQKIRQEISKEQHPYKTVASPSYQEIPLFQFLPPAKGLLISPFNFSAGHYGIDIAGREGEPIRSIYKGIIIYAGYSLTDGNFVIILHPNGIISSYKHLSVLLKNTGDLVNTNELIGTMGNTGTESHGVHLHFELWFQQKPINPSEYVLF